MKTVLGLTQNVLCSGFAVLTLGLFDGLHQGHGYLLDRAKEVAVAKKAMFVVFTFKTLPRVDRNLIITLYHKKVLLEELGVDILIELSLSSEMRNLSPLAFLLAVEKMFPSSTWVVGEDVHFGVDGSGDKDFLTQYSSAEVQVVQPYFRQEFSSTKIRQSIQSGDLKRASFLLGRNYSIMSKAHVLENTALKLDVKDLCLSTEGRWKSLALLYGDTNDISSCLTISKEKECRLDLFGKFDLPKTLFVEVIPHTHVLS